MKKSHYVVSMAFAAACGLAAGGALAEERSKGVPGVDVDVKTDVDMGRFDKNGDGMVSRDEAASKPNLAKQFTKLDANKDGQLDTAEFAKFEADGTFGTDDTRPGNEDKLGPGR